LWHLMIGDNMKKRKHRSIIIKLAKTVGMQVVPDYIYGSLILGDKIFAMEYPYGAPRIPPYGVGIGIGFDSNGVVNEAHKWVRGKLVGFFFGDTCDDLGLSAEERLRRTIRLIDPKLVESLPPESEDEKPYKERLFLIDTEGKTDEEVAEEAWEAIERYREAQAKGEDFRPVIDT
jgi:hypothetical protein